MIMKIKELREAAGMTQKRFAEELGVARSAVANWETEVALPRVRLLPELARVLGVSIEELYCWDDGIADLDEPLKS